MKSLSLFIFLFSVSVASAAPNNPACKIPLVLPPWNELVLRLWGSGGITDGTFRKNFPIIGESAAKILQSQGFEAEAMRDLTHCLLKYWNNRVCKQAGEE